MQPRQSFNRTLQLDPNFVAAYDLLVQTYLATNKLPQAISQLQGAALEEPQQCVGAHDAGARIRPDEGLPKGA